MKTDTLRHKFLAFFQKKEHKLLPSAPLVPENDPSLLFTGAGMNQFKDYFLGRATPPAKRITTCQKCLRTVDIDRVGRTPAHHTFFEMLGNFSVGDYFKKDAIAWAWEFLTVELKIPPERLSVSVYEDDEETYDIWRKDIGLPPERLHKFGESDNFWPANAPSQGPNGPCGPCSEIFYDLGPANGCGLPTCTVGCDCRRFVEIWNLVFMQFNRQEDGQLIPLPQKNIDTGMGLERLTAVLQGVTSNFEIDTFQPLIKETAQLLKITYESETEAGSRIRRIADHLRGLVFTTAEGILPSNEGRGYVVRRILRAASRDGMTLGMKKPFLYKLVPAVVEIMKAPYPELADKQPHLARIIKAEEAKFLETVEQGTALLEETMTRLSRENQKLFPGAEAFKLYDTYGFPIDLTESILAERGLKLDIKGYEEAMRLQRDQARASSQISQQIFAQTPTGQVKQFLKETRFIGYETLEAPVKIEAIIADGKLIPEALTGAEVSIITEQTPFYGESGGQAGDTGWFHKDGAEVVIHDAHHLENFIIHLGKIKKGTLKTGEVWQATVDKERRKALARNHTATHLLQNALRSLLGSHVEQSGSLVTHDRLRFDFTHFSSLSREELHRLEDMVNQRIRENHAVKTQVLSLETAKKLGALAFFGEKYGDTVRLVETGDFSKELCGGTHLTATGEIGFFKIIGESSIAAGTRRIEAVAGVSALKLLRRQEETLHEITELLETTPPKAAEKTRALLAEMKSLRQQLAQYSQADNKGLSQALLNKAQHINGVRVVAEVLENKSMDDLRAISDALRQTPEPVLVLLGTRQNDRANLIITFNPPLAQRGLDAIALIKEIAPVVGGSGGGRKDFAQAGGKDPAKLPEAVQKFIAIATEKV